MVINVTGPRGGKVSEDLASMVIDATQNFLKQLGIDRLKLDLTIRMHHSSLVDSEAEGYCDAETNRKFVIDVCLYSNWLRILAHELVHVRQFARKQLKLDGFTWMHKRYSDEVEYLNQPWEKEAFALQNKLVHVYENP